MEKQPCQHLPPQPQVTQGNTLPEPPASPRTIQSAVVNPQNPVVVSQDESSEPSPQQPLDPPEPEETVCAPDKQTRSGRLIKTPERRTMSLTIHYDFFNFFLFLAPTKRH